MENSYCLLRKMYNVLGVVNLLSGSGGLVGPDGQGGGHSSADGAGHSQPEGAADRANITESKGRRVATTVVLEKCKLILLVY
jgi:hypothetical protein